MIDEATAGLARAMATTAIVEYGARPEVPDDVRRALAALADLIASRPVFHVIEFGETGWTMMHPLFGCGPDLFGCPVNQATGWETRPMPPGRYRIDLAEDGSPLIGEGYRDGA